MEPLISGAKSGGSVVAVAEDVEQVLVFPASVLYPYAGVFYDRIVVGKTFVDEVFRKALDNSFFMDRPEAEQNPEYKQIIPYCVLWCQEKDRRYAFAYRRTKKGGENRLHEKWSVGVGGHVNPCDSETSPCPYEAAFRRELAEEVGILVDEATPPVALIYDPSDDVGKVHFGVVHLVQVDPDEVRAEDPSLASGRFQGKHTVGTMVAEGKFENWSRLVVENVNLWS